MKSLLAGLTAAVALLGCEERGVRDLSAEVPLFVVSIDTLRSDRLGVYGYEHGRTPAIDAFRGHSVLFEKAFSAAPLTLPSHATIFTGLNPPLHGVRDNLGYRIPADGPYLPEVLARNGYATGAAVSSYVLRRETGFDRGFEFFDDMVTQRFGETVSSLERDGDRTRAALVEWLGEQRANRVFAFLHLYEPHYPWIREGSSERDPYDEEVTRADAIFGRFIDDLQRLGLYDEALIILLSDHGEGLGDHGEMEHGVFLYREAIQVPLLVKLPGSARGGQTVTTPVSLADVFSTVLSAAGVARDPEGGISLFDSGPERLIYSESWYPRLHYGWSELYSMIGSDYHLIDAPETELYAYGVDPSESDNKASERRRVVADYRRELGRIRTEDEFIGPVIEDTTQVARLQALGYLGSGAAADEDALLPDPKSQIGMIERFGEGSRALQRGEYDGAAAIGEEIVRTNSDFLAAWGLIAAARRQMGDIERAIAAIEQQMSRSPGNPQSSLMLATLHLEKRNWREAEEFGRLASTASPVHGHEMIARARLGAGDLRGAALAVSNAIALGGRRPEFLLIEAELAEREQRFDEMLERLNEVASMIDAESVEPIEDLQRRRGHALLQLLRHDEAESAFRAEIERFPSNRLAWAQLALVLYGQGRTEEAREVIRRSLAVNDTPEMRQTVRDVLEIAGDGQNSLVQPRDRS